MLLSLTLTLFTKEVWKSFFNWTNVGICWRWFATRTSLVGVAFRYFIISARLITRHWWLDHLKCLMAKKCDNFRCQGPGYLRWFWACVLFRSAVIDAFVFFRYVYDMCQASVDTTFHFATAFRIWVPMSLFSRGWPLYFPTRPLHSTNECLLANHQWRLRVLWKHFCGQSMWMMKPKVNHLWQWKISLNLTLHPLLRKTGTTLTLKQHGWMKKASLVIESMFLLFSPV